MNKEDMKTSDEAIERALDLLESGDELSDGQWDEAMSDDDITRSFDDLLVLKKATLSSSAVSHINTDSEWQRFKAERMAEPQTSSVEEKPHTHHAILYTLIGVAATLLILLGYSWMTHTAKPTIPGDVVLQAVDATPHPIVTTDDGDEIELDGTPQQHKALAKLAAKETKASPLTITIPRGQTYHLLLADGSEVWLNTDCKFMYPSRFTGSERRVRIEGEAYFKVKRDPQHPFIVETAGGVETRVLGTEFNVRSYSKSDSRITLIKGSVEVRNSHNTKICLQPGQEATLNTAGAFDMAEVDVDSYIYWKEGFFYFDDITLESIMQDIGRWYNLNVVFQREAAKNYHMHFLADRKDGIERVVRLLNSMGKVQVSLEDNCLVVR